MAIEITPDALRQIKVIKQNDFTLENHYFRVQISGKGCDGFTYDLGFDEEKKQDKILEIQGFKILMQPFVYKYCKDITIDYHFNPDSGAEGFSLVNHNQDEYKGKFFKEEMI